MENKFVERMEDLKKSFIQAGVIEDVAEDVAKAYSVPSANNTILNQKFGRLLIDEGMGYVDLVVDNNKNLQLVTVDRVNAMKSSINVIDASVKLVQVESGVDPFATAGNLSSYYNLGYDVVLQSVQLCSRIDKETLQAMGQEPDWSNRVSAQIAKGFGNEYFKMCMFATPASNADADIEKGYNYVSGSAKSKPYIGAFSGWLQTLKKGYTTTKDGSSVTCAVGGKVSTYDTDNSKFKDILTVLEELVLSYPDDYNDPSEVKIIMSEKDFLRYRIAIGKANASTDKTENGNVKYYQGYEIITMPYLKGFADVVTVSATDYYPGMIIMGRPSDMVLKINVKEIEENGSYDYKLRTYDTMYDVAVVMGVIVQRFAIAYKY